jgi:DNA-binding MarR family transcriptional regulator
MTSPPEDSIDRLVAQWEHATPEVDNDTFAVSGRIQRIARFVERALERVARRNGITRRDVSLLLALRRSTRPLTPTDLLEEIAITSGGIAKRLDQLALLGFITRTGGLEDARRVVIQLTRKGRRLVDDEIRSQREPEYQVMQRLPLLRRMLIELEQLEHSLPTRDVLPTEE